MTLMTALIIDDECFAREELIELLGDIEDITVLDQASNAIEGLKKINNLKPDVVFLDIQMPQITGIELLGMLDPDSMPHVVFVTAYDQYAVQAFEDNAFDYLLKPIDPCRLRKTVKRLLKQEQQQQNAIQSIAPPTLDQIPCVGHHRIVIVPTTEVECAFSDITGVQVRTASQQANSQLSLKILEEKTPLLRCHRQYLINIKSIKEIKLLEHGLAEIITHSDFSVPVSRRYLKTLKETLGFQ